MNLVDSSGWLEFFARGKNADHFAPIIQDREHLLVPAIVVYEVFKKIYRERGEAAALIALAFMEEGKVVNIDTTLAISAAKISVETKLPMADSLILATAYRYQAEVWTQDAHFQGLPGVHYFPKNAP